MLYEETTKPLAVSDILGEKGQLEKSNGKPSKDAVTNLKEVKFISSASDSEKEDKIVDGVSRGIGKYRNLDDEEAKEAMDDVSNVRSVSGEKPAILLNNVTAKWIGEQSDDTLSNVTMRVKPGRYVIMENIFCFFRGQFRNCNFFF